jgi:hypothetical protein
MELISKNKAIEYSGLTINQLIAYSKRGIILKKDALFCKNSIKLFLESIKVNNLEYEVWKSIPNFDKRYFVSNFGRIKSTKYKGGNTERLIKPALSKGYLKSVFINENGKYQSINVHRLICLAFNPIKNYKIFEVNHKNGIKTDNNIENLEWCTRQENIKHSIDNKLQTPFKGEEIGNSKLKEFEVKEIRIIASLNKRYGRRKLAKYYNVSEDTIKSIVNNKTWNHI